jgi:hypothetical protein
MPICRQLNKNRCPNTAQTEPFAAKSKIFYRIILSINLVEIKGALRIRAKQPPIRQGVLMTDDVNDRSGESNSSAFSEPVRAVLDALAKLRFGAIQLTVHEGKLVQVDVTERTRFGN